MYLLLCPIVTRTNLHILANDLFIYLLINYSLYYAHAYESYNYKYNNKIIIVRDKQFIPPSTCMISLLRLGLM